MGNDEPPAVLFGRRVREERLKRDWRLADLAAAAAEHGLTRHLTLLSKVENGAQEPKLGEAVAIAAAFGLPLGALLTASSGIGAEVERLNAEAAALAAQSDESLRRAVMLRNQAQLLIAGEQ